MSEYRPKKGIYNFHLKTQSDLDELIVFLTICIRTVKTDVKVFIE